MVKMPGQTLPEKPAPTCNHDPSRRGVGAHGRWYGHLRSVEIASLYESEIRLGNWFVDKCHYDLTVCLGSDTVTPSGPRRRRPRHGEAAAVGVHQTKRQNSRAHKVAPDVVSAH